MTEIALLYARVSTEDQAAKAKGSIPHQLTQCRRFAEARGWTVRGEFQDSVSGALEAADRPGLTDLLEAVGELDVTRIVVYSPDRLARELFVSATILRAFEARGASVVFVQGSLDASTPEGRFIFDILSAFAAYERLQIGLRNKVGKKAKARKGETFTGARPPFGYTQADNNLEVVEEEADVVRQIFDLYAEGNSMRGVVREVEGIPSPADRRAGKKKFAAIHKKQPRGRWAVSTIRGILSNRTYIGEWTYTPSGGEPIVVKVPAIVDEDLFDQVQEIRQRNQWSKRKEPTHRFLFRYRVTCSNCGRSRFPVAESPSRPRSYYICNGTHQAHKEDKCKSLSVPARHLETRVANWIVELISEPEQVEEYLSGLRKESDSTEVKKLKSRVARLNASIAEEDSVIERLLSEFVSGKWGEAQVSKLKREAEKNRQRLVQERMEVQAELNAKYLDPEEAGKAWAQTLDRMRSLVDPGGWRRFTDNLEEEPEPGDLATWAEWTDGIGDVLDQIIEDLDVRVACEKGRETEEVLVRVSCQLGFSDLSGEVSGSPASTIAPSRPRTAQEWTFASMISV